MNVEFVRESLSWKSEDPAELLFFSGDPVLFLNLIFGKFLLSSSSNSSWSRLRLLLANSLHFPVHHQFPWSSTYVLGLDPRPDGLLEEMKVGQLLVVELRVLQVHVSQSLLLTNLLGGWHCRLALSLLSFLLANYNSFFSFYLFGKSVHLMNYFEFKSGWKKKVFGELKWWLLVLPLPMPCWNCKRELLIVRKNFTQLHDSETINTTIIILYNHHSGCSSAF